ncbi:hypothetical protein B194_0933 [Serratia plymuthica A30]|nr:hypothetical protein B194_0933 [Serratia plymuthica A30]
MGIVRHTPSCQTKKVVIVNLQSLQQAAGIAFCLPDIRFVLRDSLRGGNG